jgi:hypothetical protein
MTEKEARKGYYYGIYDSESGKAKRDGKAGGKQAAQNRNLARSNV